MENQEEIERGDVRVMQILAGNNERGEFALDTNCPIRLCDA
jgi:hypothetical protein